ncbi:aa3-type cytochrome oxidase subunit CtaJ [Mycobacterium sp. C31M]
MSTALTHGLMGGIPLLLFLVLAALAYRHKGPHPEPYKLSEEWTHDPILWAADEPADHGHGGHGDHVTVGGGASGKW